MKFIKEKGRKVLIFLLIATIIASVAVLADSATKKTKIKAKSISLNVPAVTLAVGDIASLKATMKPANATDSLKWTTSNKNVATISSSGVITAKTEGTAKITVKTTSKKSAVCKVTVKKYLTKKEIIALIASNTLSKESINALIQKQTLSQEEIVSIVKSNTLSEAEIKALIAKEVESTDFEDGQELQPVGLPYQSENVIINNVIIKKYHCNEWEQSGVKIPQKIRYELEIEGQITKADPDFKDIILGITYLPEEYGQSAQEDYTSFGEFGAFENISYTIDADGNFVYKTNQYNFMENLGTFYIRYASAYNMNEPY